VSTKQISEKREQLTKQLSLSHEQMSKELSDKFAQFEDLMEKHKQATQAFKDLTAANSELMAEKNKLFGGKLVAETVREFSKCANAMFY
jgi:hypothetical protein